MTNQIATLQKKVLPPLPPGQFEMIAPYSISVADSLEKSRVQVTFLRQAKWLLIALAPTVPNLLPSSQTPWWLLFLMVALVGAFLLRTARKSDELAKQPTHIQLGEAGIRTHHLRTAKYDCVWLPWESVTRVRINEKNPKQILFTLAETPESAIFLTSAKTKELIIQPSAITRYEDRAAFFAILKKFLKPEQIDSAIFQEFQQTDLSYTNLWLREFSSPALQNNLNTLPGGTQLAGDKYQIVQSVGSGGQSVTYKAYRKENEHKDFVILKEFVLPVQAGIEIRQRAMRSIEHEVELLKKFDNRHVVKFIDCFTAGDRAYLCLEHINGQTLQSLASHRICTEREIVKLGLGLCDALATLCERAVIHRDITPDNVMVREDGTIVLIDFNVAHHIEAQMTRDMVGKHCYIPPEQFKGRATFQSDIYAVGCCLFFLATAEHPEALTTSHPRSLRPELSEQFDQLVAKCTAQELSERYADQTALKNALQKILESIDDANTTNPDLCLSQSG